MNDIRVRVLGQDEWRLYRRAAVAALQEAPEAFPGWDPGQAPRGDQFWRERMAQADRIIAERGDELVGLVCLVLHHDDHQTGEVFGLWTAPKARRERVAWDLVTTAAHRATTAGCEKLYFWVDCDNAAAIAFASAFGFLPTDHRWPLPDADDGHILEGEGEMAMALPLTPDPKQPPRPPGPPTVAPSPHTGP